MVTAVGQDQEHLIVRWRTADEHRLEREEIGAAQLAHGYATTVHRSQGATHDLAHVYEDGGGRELAYVAMSRARDETHVYLCCRRSGPGPRGPLPQLGDRAAVEVGHRHGHTGGGWKGFSNKGAGLPRAGGPRAGAGRTLRRPAQVSTGRDPGSQGPVS